jgi:hypothetical protein
MNDPMDVDQGGHSSLLEYEIPTQPNLPSGVVDIDGPDASDPYHCSTYVQEIYNNMKCSEASI